jgi:sodium-dependent dicarboxylate transporter 2/3/5
MQKRQIAGLFSGLLIFIILIFLPTPEGMSLLAQRAAAVTLLMATWWITEALPISATALVPLVLFPFLGVLDAKNTAENYGHNYVLMLLTGLIIAKAIEEHNLHRRIALAIINLIGTSRRRIILSVMVATAFLSMWMANVAVTLLMLPIGIAIIESEFAIEEGEKSKFGLALMLAIAYAASIGGMGTLIGTPPNMVFAGMIRTLYPNAPEISFFEWMVFGLPLVLILLPVVWLYLVLFYKIEGSFSGSSKIIENELRALGPMSTAERRVLIIFILTALGWSFRTDFVFNHFTIPGWASLLGVSGFVHDSTVAAVSTLLLFIIPSGVKSQKGENAKTTLLDWKSAESVPWGVVLIVGGGYAIAESFTATGLADWIGKEVAFVGGLPIFFVLLTVVLFITFLTEINSNTATANIFLPILATMAVAGHAHPFLLMIPGTIASSCAFMLPSGTGSNAVIFASGRVTIPEMAACGFYLNFISIAIITIIMYLIAVPLFGISQGVPAWAQ